MTAELFSPPSRALSATADPYAGAKWFFYQTGTLTPLNVYSDAPLLTPLSNPVVADSGGKFPAIYFDSASVYRGICKDASGAVTLHDIDPINSGIISVLSGPTGASVIGTKRTEIFSVPLTLDQLIGQRPINVRQAGLTGSYSQDATSILQSIFDQAPAGAVIEFGAGFLDGLGGDYRITSTVYIRKHLHLVGHNSRIIGVMADNNTDLIHIKPTTEVRNFTMRGLRLGFNSGGRTALKVGNHSVGFLHGIFENLQVSSGLGGWAMDFTGLGTHFNTIRNCYISGAAFAEDPVSKIPLRGGLRLNCADATKVYDNLFSELGCGLLVDLVPGAYKTHIYDNGFVSRDGGIFLTRGSKIDIGPGNTYEQGGSLLNQATYKGHIVSYGSAYAVSSFTGSVSGDVLTVTAVASGSVQTGMTVSDTFGNISPHIRVKAQITGGGGVGTYRLSDATPSIIASQAFIGVSDPVQSVTIDKDQFGSGSAQDASIILVADNQDFILDNLQFNALGNSGQDINVITKASNINHVYGNKMKPGGARAGISVRGTANSLNPRDLIKVSNGGGAEAKGYFARKAVADLGALGAGWSASTDFSFWVDEEDRLKFSGNLLVGATAGSNAGGFLVGTLPSGCVVPANTLVAVPNTASATPAIFTFDNAGGVRVSANVNLSTTFFFSQASPVFVQGRSSYFSSVM